MKVLVQREPLTVDILPFDLAALKAHLRVEFDDDDSAITIMGQTAAHELEHFAQVALLRQSITVSVFDPLVDMYFELPVSPSLGEPTVELDSAAYSAFDFLGGIRPCIRWQNPAAVSAGKRLTVTYDAGFGEDATSIPRDLAQALMDQAALHYDARGPVDAKTLIRSPHMARVGARYRGVSL